MPVQTPRKLTPKYACFVQVYLLASLLIFVLVSSALAQPTNSTECLNCFTVTSPDLKSCRTRLPKALAKARKYVPDHRAPSNITNAVIDYSLPPQDGEGLARWKLAQIIEEKALAAEIDALLQECTP